MKLNPSRVDNLQHSSATQAVVAAKPETHLQTILQLDVRQLSVSLVGKVQEFFKEKVVSRRKELALLTIKGLRLDKTTEENSFDLDLKIDHFQIDNQTERNPLFQQIFLPKVFIGQGNSENPGRRNRNNRGIPEFNPFFRLRINSKYNAEADVTFVEKFNCRVGDAAMQFDDEFLVSSSYSISHVTNLLSDHKTRVHPIFMKDSYLAKRDNLAEQVNVDSILSSELASSAASHQKRLMGNARDSAKDANKLPRPRSVDS